MTNLFLYLATVFIWGTTWLAIKLQLGDVSPEVSIFYRFLFAFSLLLFFCKIKGMNLKFRFKDHVFFFLLGLCMFSVHLLFIYTAIHIMIQKSVFCCAYIPAFEPASIAPVPAQALLQRRLRLAQIQGADFAKIPIFESRCV